MKFKMKWYRRLILLNRRRSILITFVVLVTLYLFILSFRNTFLEQAIQKAKLKLKRDYDCELTVKEARFSGFTEVELQEIALVPIQKDTLFTTSSLKIKINFLPLLKGAIQVHSLTLENTSLALLKNKKGTNYEAFLKKKDEDSDAKHEKIDYADLAERITSSLLNFIPENMKAHNLKFKVQENRNFVQATIPEIQFTNQTFNFETHIKTENSEQHWILNGKANPRKRKATIQLSAKNDSIIKIPFIKEKFGLKTEFRKAIFEIYKMELHRNVFHIEGKTSIENLLVHHKKIAPKDITISNSSVSYHTLIEERSVTIDSSSVVEVEKIKINPYLKIQKEQDTTITASITIPKIKAQDFINSLPRGLFSQIEDLQIEGNFDYHFLFAYTTSKPDDILFESTLTNDKLKVTRFGNADLLKLNSDFTYQPIENGIPQQKIFISPNDPNFIPLHEISPYLQKSVITSEDPFFFQHKGFEPDAFKQSILKNIHTKQFSRGASTISMQLVKNIFLTKEKTITRKLEEVILVYLLENNTNVKKERILEIYFNIIEWGPGVYGVQEASQFYFDKSAKDLSLEESLFLTSIVPKPKKFIWQFDAYGNLKKQVSDRNKFIESVMLKRGLITPNDTLIKPSFSIKGPAKKYLKIAIQDSIVPDSISTDLLILDLPQ
ncbi:glycosyl transferase [Flavobacterium sediminis]|uniref:Glycosyl transferase n=1 Tax=Flavobacterium sediminis TaxID=2201181 RepID=A0A2U8QSV5_9FLAO|nr:biosynthetic peptidoglycan transglycosylase [Flavobacterium sediminis]AWM13179.1 glycosyl transferase [Flavobacterium sediminis]